MPASTSVPAAMLCEMARTVDELAFVAPETPMMSPAFTIFWFAVAALSPTTFGTMHLSVDFSAPR